MPQPHRIFLSDMRACACVCVCVCVSERERERERGGERERESEKCCTDQNTLSSLLSRCQSIAALAKLSKHTIEDHIDCVGLLLLSEK